MPKQLRTTMSTDECKTVQRTLRMCEKFIQQSTRAGHTPYPIETVLQHIKAARKLVPTGYLPKR